MESKKLIACLKGCRTRYSKNADPKMESKVVTSLLKDSDPSFLQMLKEKSSDLYHYVNTVLSVSDLKAPKLTRSPVVLPSENTECLAHSTKGVVYEIDTIKKTCKRVLSDLSQLADTEIEMEEMPMTVYQRYLKDKFFGETVVIKKGKLLFRGYRVSCTKENGFMIEDTMNKYKVVDTTFEGIPTPAELGEFFVRPRVEHTPEDLHAAVERGKQLASEKTKTVSIEVEEPEEVDFETLRLKVLGKINAIREGKVSNFDPVDFPKMIPFRRWKRSVSIHINKWKNKKLRYKTLLAAIEKVTREETFVVEEKNHRSSFVGTILPEFKTVGRLIGNKLEVDGKLVDAVPFLQAHLLHYEPKAMQQLMRFARHEIDAVTLLQNPYHDDWKIEYNSKLLPNTKEVADILSALHESIGLCVPQDVLYEADLKIGDKILIFVDGSWKRKTITELENGICINKGVGLMKYDKWIKLDDEKK